MSADPAFPFYAQDFLTGVMHLTMEERGQYITLLSYQWAHHEIPKKRLGLIIGVSWENLSEEVRVKFKETENSIVNERLESERDKRARFKEKQVENGKRGGRPPKEEKPKQNPNKTQIQSQTLTQKKPLESENEYEDEVEYDDVTEAEKKKTKLQIPKIEIHHFEEFWNAYGKKTDTAKCKLKFESLKLTEKEKILEVVSDYVKSTPDPKYRKNPLTWLNGKCWNDEIIFNTNQNGNNSNDQGRRKQATFNLHDFIPKPSDAGSTI